MSNSPPLSKMRSAGGLVFTSGQLPRNEDGIIVAGDIVAQTQQTMDNLEALLASQGLTLSNVVKVTVWLTDGADVSGFNEVYRSRFKQPYPSRSLVISQLAVVGAKLEVEAVASIENRT